MMYIDPKKKLDLSSAHFDEMRHDLDRYITKMLPIMEAKNTQAGTISLKIDFSILEDKVKCENSPTGEREALIPTINYKIAMTLQSKAENKGYVVSGGHEVVQEGSDYYIVTKEEAGGQLNMFDSSRAFSFGGATSAGRILRMPVRRCRNQRAGAQVPVR